MDIMKDINENLERAALIFQKLSQSFWELTNLLYGGENNDDGFKQL